MAFQEKMMSFQIFWTTLDEERWLFTGEESCRWATPDPERSSLLPGLYRVIDGELFRIVSEPNRG